MANLPRLGRTWQRFSSLPRPGTASRPEVPPPQPTTTEPEVFPSAATTTNVLQTSPIKERSSRLSSPVRKFPSPPSSPKYRASATTSPVKPLSPTPTYNRYDGERRTSATTSPKNFKPAHPVSPVLSPPRPKYSTAAATLSPLTLPRSEARPEPEYTIRSKSPPEVQQKTVLYQKTFEKQTKTDHRQSEYTSDKPHQKNHHQQQHQHQQSDVINIKGDNVGAVMHITQSNGTEIVKKKPTLDHSNESDEKANRSSSDFPAKSFMNSNFQGVNNSILYNSSLSHRDPGLHLAFSKKPNHGDSLYDSRH